MSDNHLLTQQKKRIESLKERGIDAYIDQAIQNNTTIKNLFQKFNHYTKKDLEQLRENQYTLQISGRVVRFRNQGGVIFLNLWNENNTIQVFIKKNRLSETDFFLARSICIGDIIHVSGEVMKTNTNALTIKCQTVKLLTIALLSLPAKTRLGNDVEVEYRQRYLDLLTNPESFARAQKRSEIVHQIREFLHQQQFMEVETPILESIYGGAIAEPFTTFHNKLKQNFFLRVSEEISLKKLLIGGFNRIFEIGRIFRNEGISTKHNPEFTLLEWYEAFATLKDTKNKCMQLFQHIAWSLNKKFEITCGNNIIDLSISNWTSIKMVDSITKNSGVDFNDILTLSDAKTEAKKCSVTFSDNRFLTIGKIIEAFFQKFVEPTLISPTFVCDFPFDISPLAKKVKIDNRYCQRFELYINGWEVANAFNELTDYFDQKQRLEKQKSSFVEFSQLKEIDNNFLDALKYGMPPASGIGIGIDRLIMLFTNVNSIKKVILFPTLRNLSND